MTELPTGTVTLVFTDIEGSTRLLASLGSRYEAVLANHRRLLRDAFSSHHGIEVDTQGDALFYGFPKAHDAVTAAVEAQRALDSHDFAEGVELRVRMGIHSGEPTVTHEGYVGADVHLGARICAAAWGAQIVVSSATAGLLSSGLEDVTLSSLGDHALKDIEERVELFQVVAPGLTEDFPALRTKGTHPTNLPPRLASLIGREQDLAALKELLASPQTSVVTLVGPGGTGKTSLAAALGAQLLSSFADGVYFVDLSVLNDPALVIPAIARALSLREIPGRSPADTLAHHLSSKQLLLILDNFEQVMGAAPEISFLVTAAPAVKVLVTSRETLRVRGEKEFSVAPLAVPPSSDDPQAVADSPAVALFLSRAKDARPDLELDRPDLAVIADICRRLDGLPLAIELAAARVKVLSLPALNERLEQGLKVLTSGRRDASERQRTLRGAIAWSYDLLSDDEQTLFRRLAVFAGGWRLEAAEAVCEQGDLDLDVLDGLASLVDKSLVRTREHEDRFIMLETIRSFAAEELEASGEAEDIRRAHAEFFRRLAEEAEPHTVQGSQQLRWLELLDVEHDNLRAALTHLTNLGDGEGHSRLAVALAPFWRLHSHLTEGRERLLEALSRGGNDPLLTTRLLTSLGLIAHRRGEYGDARAFLEQSLELSEQFGLEERIDANLNDLGMVSLAEGDYEGARSLYRRSMRIAHKINDKLGVACATHNLADLALNERDHVAARDLAIQSLRLWEEIGDAEGRATSLVNAGLATTHLGDIVEAAKLLSEALSAARVLASKEVVAGCLDGFASIAATAGEVERAARLLGAAEGLRDEIGATAERFERQLHETTMSLVGAELGEQGVARAISQGRSATAEETLAEVLSVTEQIVEPRDEPA